MKLNENFKKKINNHRFKLATRIDESQRISMCKYVFDNKNITTTNAGLIRHWLNTNIGNEDILSLEAAHQCYYRWLKKRKTRT
jgi:hypothetical protein